MDLLHSSQIDDFETQLSAYLTQSNEMCNLVSSSSNKRKMQEEKQLRKITPNEYYMLASWNDLEFLQKVLHIDHKDSIKDSFLQYCENNQCKSHVYLIRATASSNCVAVCHLKNDEYKETYLTRDTKNHLWNGSIFDSGGRTPLTDPLLVDYINKYISFNSNCLVLDSPEQKKPHIENTLPQPQQYNVLIEQPNYREAQQMHQQQLNQLLLMLQQQQFLLQRLQMKLTSSPQQPQQMQGHFFDKL